MCEVSAGRFARIGQGDPATSWWRTARRVRPRGTQPLRFPQLSGHGQRQRATWQPFVLLVAISLLATACGGDSSDDRSAPRAGSTTSRAATPTTAPPPSTQPPATDVDRVRPIFDALMDRYDNVVAAVLADPRVASDPNDARVRAFVELFPPGSTFAQGSVDNWVQLGQQGRVYVPGPRGRLQQTSVVMITPRGADEASFTVCSLLSMVVKDASGATVESQGGNRPGVVVAVRVDGRWLLRDLTLTTGQDCPRPGASR